MRRGKALVERMFVATGNDENEYGKAIPERAMPFTSSSNDVLQAAVRCNADYQYQKRCVPDLDAPSPDRARQPAQPEPAAVVPGFLVYGCRRTCAAVIGLILTTLATAMRAANVADFYMTKYQSKAQEALGPIMQPFIAGMRRIEAEEAEKV